MKAALIAPIPHLQDMEHLSDGFHLVLSHLLHIPDYTLYYRRKRKEGDYLLLDNGAHENSIGAGIESLLLHAKLLGAQEIALPDCLDDSYHTYYLMVEALEHIVLHKKWIAEVGEDPSMDLPRLMIVPQGRDVGEWADCLERMGKEYHRYCARYPDIFTPSLTIGVSKDLEDDTEGSTKYILKTPIKRYLHLYDHNNEDTQVHLLGWGRPLWYLQDVVQDFPWVRSIDSARPFVYAAHGIMVDPYPHTPPPPYPGREQDYFTARLSQESLQIAQWNAQVFRGIAHGEEFIHE